MIFTLSTALAGLSPLPQIGIYNVVYYFSFFGPIILGTPALLFVIFWRYRFLHFWHSSSALGPRPNEAYLFLLEKFSHIWKVTFKIIKNLGLQKTTTLWNIRGLECCIFQSAFECCALQTMVKIVIFRIFCAKKLKKARCYTQKTKSFTQ